MLYLDSFNGFEMIQKCGLLFIIFLAFNIGAQSFVNASPWNNLNTHQHNQKEGHQDCEPPDFEYEELVLRDHEPRALVSTIDLIIEIFPSLDGSPHHYFSSLDKPPQNV